MISQARTSHIGSCLSVADILAVLYGSILRVDPKRPTWPDRDRLIMSKGHAAAITYAAVAEAGFMPLARLEEYGKNGGQLGERADERGPHEASTSASARSSSSPTGCL